MIPGQVIATAADLYAEHPANQYVKPDRGAEWVFIHWSRRDVPRFYPLGTNTTVTAYARLNHARWIIDCPFCPSAQVGCRTDHRYFCMDCLNEKVGSQWIPVVWPDEAIRATVEAQMRPEMTEDVNWVNPDQFRALAQAYLTGYVSPNPVLAIAPLDETSNAALPADVTALLNPPAPIALGSPAKGS